MPAVLKVANYNKTQQYDFTGSSSKVRLISATFTDTTSENGEPVELSFQTITKGTAVEIREALRDVEYIFARATRFHQDLTEQNSIWIYAQSDGNEKERRSLVMSWQRIDTVQHQSDPLLDRTKTVISTWSISRNGYWEAIAGNKITLSDSDDLFAGLNDFGAYVGSPPPSASNRGFAIISTPFTYGTAPGRILSIGVKSATQDITQRFWFGIKPVNASVSSWQAHASFDETYGTVYTYFDFDTNHTYSSALNGKCGRVTFASGDNLFRNRGAVKVPPANISPAIDDELIRGTYLVLFRMKASSSTNSEFRTAMFASGESEGFLGDTYQDVFVSHNLWNFYEMGVIQIPLEGFRKARRDHLSPMSGYMIGLAAERMTGTDDLLIDYAVLIPQDHAIACKNMEQLDTMQGYIITDEDGAITGISEDTVTWSIDETMLHEISASNWVFPADSSQNGIVVAVIDSDTRSVVQDTAAQSCEYSMEIVPRYFSYNAD